MTTQITSVRPLLDYIARFESRGDYNIVWGGIRSADKPPRQLVTMTVEEVLNWQDSIDRKYMSEAAGRYQIMEDTLRGLYRPAGVPLTQLFDRDTQDRLGLALLRRRGLDDYLSGSMSAERFALSLSKEWASLPVPFDVKRGDKTVQKGQSYYAGDGLNKAHADVDEFLVVVQSIRGQARPAPREKVSESSTVQAVVRDNVGKLGITAGGLMSWWASQSQETQNMLYIAAAIVVAGLLVSGQASWKIIRERIAKWSEGDR